MRIMISAILLLASVNIADGVPVDPDNPHGIAAVFSQFDLNQATRHYVLCVNGSVYRLERSVDPDFIWSQVDMSLPVDVAQVSNWTLESFTTVSGNVD